MPTTRTLSGTIDKFRQGVSIRTFGQLHRSLFPRISVGTPYAILVSGSVEPVVTDYNSLTFKAFDDQAAGSPRERLNAPPGYKTIINHLWVHDVFGESDTGFKEGTPFVEKNAIVSGTLDKMITLTSAENSGTLPLAVRYSSLRSLDQMDGVIEPFPIRRLVDFSFNNLPPSFPSGKLKAAFFRGVKAELYYMTPGDADGEVAQYVDLKEANIPPYNDMNSFSLKSIEAKKKISSVFNDVVVKVPAASTTSNFVETSVNVGWRYEYVYSKDGFGPTFMGTTPIANAVAAMTGSKIESFYGQPSKCVSTTAGFTYSTSNAPGWKMGTDSLAFGGFKK
tara:strand:- start:10506 stop:11513 length:1008 start_codon:yes stop_codon:yes gene_type:complete